MEKLLEIIAILNKKMLTHYHFRFQHWTKLTIDGAQRHNLFLESEKFCHVGDNLNIVGNRNNVASYTENERKHDNCTQNNTLVLSRRQKLESIYLNELKVHT